MISIVIPVYNEEANLPPLHQGIAAAMGAAALDYEIVFVDDGSTDGSAAKLADLAERDKRVKVVHLRRNFGQTAAIMAGFNHGGGDIVVTMDADMQNDPADIPALLAKLDEGFDVVSGWRRDRQDDRLTRLIPSQIANWVISRLSGVALHDYGCTLKAYRRGVLSGVRLYGEMHRFIPIHAHWQGAAVTEMPVRHHARRHGVSNYGLSRIPRVLLDLIVIRFLDRALDRPIHFFGRAGLYSLVLAILAGIWALYLKFVEGTSFILTPLPLLVVLFALTGVLCILLGLVGEMQSRIYFEAQNKFPYAVKSTRNL